MYNLRLKKFVYWVILIFIIISIAELAGYMGMCYKSRQFDFLGNTNYFAIRSMLMGTKDSDQFPRYLTLPNMGYIPYPGYYKHGIAQHNQDGYRGNRLALKHSEKLRILCLGESTTYGFGVDSPYQTYPARLEAILNEHINEDSTLSKHFTGAEVINGGIEASTSVEQLEQYLLKYRYYQPDIVIVHGGINDAQLAANSGNGDMQLDYTDKRRLLFNLNALQGPGRCLLHSYFFSFWAIYLFFENNYEQGADFNRSKGQIYCNWSSVKMDTVIARQNWAFYPFYRNTKTLFEQIRADRSELIVMPDIVNPICVAPDSKYAQITGLNAELSKQLCDSVSGFLLPFQFDSISRRETWIDDCHLKAFGENEKAAMAARFIMQPPFIDALLKR